MQRDLNLQGVPFISGVFLSIFKIYNRGSFIWGFELEPCAGVIASAAAARRSILVGGGAARRGTAWAVKFSDVAYLFQQFFSKKLLLSKYAC